MCKPSDLCPVLGISIPPSHAPDGCQLKLSSASRLLSVMHDAERMFIRHVTTADDRSKNCSISAQELDCANQVFWLKQFFLAEVLPQVFLGGMSREQKLALPGVLAACPGPYNILQFRLLSSRLLRNPGRAVQPTAFRFASAYHRVPRSRIR